MGLEDLNPLDNEESGAKATEQSDEVFRDKQRKAQAAQKAFKKAEGKARQKDDQLAKVIGHFLQSQSNTAVMLLIARCLDHNIPAGLILGVLSLVEPKAQTEFENVLEDSEKFLKAGPNETENAPTQALSEQDTDHLPPNVKKKINTWTGQLLEFSLTQPQRILSTTISPSGDLFPNLSQLCTFILQQYLEQEKLPAGYENVNAFSEILLKSVFGKVQNYLLMTKELNAGEAEE